MICTLHLEVLCVSNFRLAFFGFHHIGPLDSVVVRVNPENVLHSGIEVDSLHSLFLIYYVHRFSFVQIVGSKFGSISEQYDNVIVFDVTHAAVAVRQSEALPARASVRAVQIGADVRTLMLTSLALIDVHAMFPIILRDYVAGITGADVAAVGGVVALLRATAAINVRAMLMMI